MKDQRAAFFGQLEAMGKWLEDVIVNFTSQHDAVSFSTVEDKKLDEIADLVNQLNQKVKELENA